MKPTSLQGYEKGIGVFIRFQSIINRRTVYSGALCAFRFNVEYIADADGSLNGDCS